MALLRELRANSISVCLGLSRSSTVRGTLRTGTLRNAAIPALSASSQLSISRNCYAKIHVLSRVWEPRCSKRRRAFEFVVQVYED